jgi:DNA-binding FadR family transcriptional regulator
MRSLIEARRALETGAAVTAALQAGAVDWSRPHAALDTFATAVSAGEWSATEAAHLAFHLSLLRVVQNRSLDVLLEPLHEVIVTTSLHPELSEPEVWELVWHLPSHRELLAAMESGDRTRTLAAVDAHFAYVDHPRYAEFLDMRLSEIPAVRRRLVEQLSQ